MTAAERRVVEAAVAYRKAYLGVEWIAPGAAVDAMWQAVDAAVDELDAAVDAWLRSEPHRPEPAVEEMGGLVG